jgi:ABC-2 type transport system permease protein
MRNLFLVIRHEILTTLRKRSFWFMTFVFPLAILVVTFGAQVLGGREMQTAEPLLPTPGMAAELPATGYVDQAGIITRLPGAVPPTLFRGYPDEGSAAAALAAGEVERYFVITPGYVEHGEVVLVQQEFRPFSDGGEGLLNYVLRYNLTGDEALAMLLMAPAAGVERHALVEAPAAESGGFMQFIVPFATMFIFFFVITMSSGFMLQSVAREKENRTMEVLLVTLQPRQLMLGKILGLSVVALLQMAIWAGGPLLVLGRGQDLLGIAGAVTLPTGFLLWALLYFLLGYLLYASLMGAIGALAPTAREGSQFTFFVLLPLLIPLWLNSVFIHSPDGTLAVALSLFPLTAPTSMMTRLVATSVPGWQLGISLLGLALTTYLLVALAARFFRADTLLAGGSLHWRQFLEVR